MIQCGPRDASWHNRPNVRHPAKWHITLDGVTAACGQRLMIYEPGPLGTEPPTRRCQKPGCKEHWPKPS